MAKLYCHRGCRTAFNFLALRSLGYKDIRIYEDAFVVWSNWFELPVEQEHYINLWGDINKAVDRANILWEESKHGEGGH